MGKTEKPLLLLLVTLLSSPVWAKDHKRARPEGSLSAKLASTLGIRRLRSRMGTRTVTKLTPTESQIPIAQQPSGAPTQPPQQMRPAVPEAYLPPVRTNADLNSPVTAENISGDWEEEETTPHQAAKDNEPAVVRNITVSRNKDVVEVHIEGSKLPPFTVSALSDTRRIVIDLANTRLPHRRRIAVKSGDVQDVEGFLYLVNPLVTRVVVNLTRPHAYRLLPSGNTVTVRIEAEELKTTDKATVAAVAVPRN